MGGGALSVEEARGRDQADAGANTGNCRTAFVPAAQPGNNPRVALDHVVEADTCRWDKDDFRFANSGKCDRGGNANGSIAPNGAAVGGCGGDAKARNRLFAGEDIPERTGVQKDFHRADSGGRKSAVKQQNHDIDHGCSLRFGVNTTVEWHICHLGSNEKSHLNCCRWK